ncbi:hypothetical protein B0H11DRAFT_2279405 [Mycena galericulata]|nr:hypothetical protein B0H11DRAFT_2279405 [Mycena galericulata]
MRTSSRLSGATFTDEPVAEADPGMLIDDRANPDADYPILGPATLPLRAEQSRKPAEEARKDEEKQEEAATVFEDCIPDNTRAALKLWTALSPVALHAVYGCAIPDRFGVTFPPAAVSVDDDPLSKKRKKTRLRTPVPELATSPSLHIFDAHGMGRRNYGGIPVYLHFSKPAFLFVDSSRVGARNPSRLLVVGTRACGSLELTNQYTASEQIVGQPPGALAPSPPLPLPHMQTLFSVLEFLVALALLSLFALASPPSGLAHTILEDEITYQDTEIARLEKLVKTRHADVHRYQADVSRLTMEAHCLKTALRGTAELVEATELADAALEALSSHVEAQTAWMTELTAQYNAECTERAVAASMNWAMEREIEELQQTVKELRECSQGVGRQRSICEARQTAVIKTLKEHVKTAARWGTEKETRIHLMEEQIAAKEREKEEVARIAEELAVGYQAAYDAQRRRSKQYVKDMKTKWAAAWEWASEERRELRSRLGELVDADDSFVSMANLFADSNDENDNLNEELANMSICSVIESAVQPSPLCTVEKRIPIPQARPAPWVPSPSKILAGRCFVSKMALSANPPNSPFAFATNSVKFAPADIKCTKDRSAKRVKLDREGEREEVGVLI